MKGVSRWPGLIAAALLCACTVGPDYERSDMAVPESFTAAPPPEVAAAAAPAAWWTGYGEPELTRLVAAGLAENLDIRTAEARLAEAQALVDEEASGFYPSFDGTAGAGIEDTSGAGGDGTDTDADAGFVFGWVPDLFGGTRRSVEAAEAEEARLAALYADAARLTVNAVVQVYIAVRRDMALRALVSEAIDTRTRSLELVDARVDVGLAPDFDSARAAADLASTRAQLPALDQSARAGRAALDVLVGDWPRAVLPATEDAPTVPVFQAGPPLDLTQSVLLARPDVAAAEADLRRTTAEIGVATAALYPSISLPGELGASISDFGTADAVTTFIAALALRLDIPLFDAGGRRARVEGAEARAQAALFAYRQALLIAAQEAETALVAVGNLRARRDELREAADASERAHTRATQLFDQGIVDFFDVLDARRTLLETQQDFIAAEANLALAFADLYTALGPAAYAPMPEAADTE